MKPLSLWERHFFWGWLLLVSLAPIALEITEVGGLLQLTQGDRWFALAGAAIIVLFSVLLVVPPSSLSVSSWLRFLEFRLFTLPFPLARKESNHDA